MMFHTMSPHMLGGFQMAAPQVMTLTEGPASLQGRVVFLGGKAFMLQECDPSSVYCNALEGFEPLSEGADGPRVWRPPVATDPGSVDPWLQNVGGGIY